MSSELTSVPGRLKRLEEAQALHQSEGKARDGRIQNVETAVKLAGKISLADMVKIVSATFTVAGGIAALVLFAIRSETTANTKAIEDLKQDMNNQEAITRGLSNKVSYLRGRNDEEGGAE